MPSRIFIARLLGCGRRRHGNRLRETRARAFVADDAFALDFNLDQERIAVAIRAGGNHFQAIAGSFAFSPKLVAGAAIKSYVADR